MIFGVPKEILDQEMRVGLTPHGADTLVKEGHKVLVETGGGKGAWHTDEDYKKVGATVVYSADEVWGRADVICKVKTPQKSEWDKLRENQIVGAFQHLPVAPAGLLKAYTSKKCTPISYEMIQDDDGTLPVLKSASEIAGKMMPQVAASLLWATRGGKGILLGGCPGVPSAAIGILGGGVLGFNAARAFNAIGAQVTVLDRNVNRLAFIEDHFGGVVNTLISSDYNIRKVISFSDVFIGCVNVPGHLTPHLVTREMVRLMSPGAVIIDASIDQGGCVETSRPTTLRTPTFVEEGIVHYCVPSMTSEVSRTASAAHTNSILPYLLRIGKLGIDEAARQDHTLSKGITVLRGEAVGKPQAATTT
jgi:alanine dehydrogenase